MNPRDEHIQHVVRRTAAHGGHGCGCSWRRRPRRCLSRSRYPVLGGGGSAGAGAPAKELQNVTAEKARDRGPRRDVRACGTAASPCAVCIVRTADCEPHVRTSSPAARALSQVLLICLINGAWMSILSASDTSVKDLPRPVRQVPH